MRSKDKNNRLKKIIPNKLNKINKKIAKNKIKKMQKIKNEFVFMNFNKSMFFFIFI